jgi:hypothetical protein
MLKQYREKRKCDIKRERGAENDEDIEIVKGPAHKRRGGRDNEVIVPD